MDFLIPEVDLEINLSSGHVLLPKRVIESFMGNWPDHGHPWGGKGSTGVLPTLDIHNECFEGLFRNNKTGLHTTLVGYMKLLYILIRVWVLCTPNTGLKMLFQCFLC